jgi:hypothetical protein
MIFVHVKTGFYGVASSLLLAYIYVSVFILLLLMKHYPVAIVGSRIIKTGLFWLAVVRLYMEFVDQFQKVLIYSESLAL